MWIERRVKSMKKSIVRCLIVLAVCTAVLVWSWSQINVVGNDLQYLVPAPQLTASASNQPETDQADADSDENSASDKTDTKTVPNQAVQVLWESLKNTAEGWTGVIQAYTLSGVAEKTSMLSDTGETKQARLTALSEGAFTLMPQYVRFGRLFYPEELQKGCNGILLDEQLALALFHISEPVGRTVTISDIDFTVIGILRHSLRVGDGEDYGALVTLPYLWDRSLQLQALQVSALPVAGAGAHSTFSTSMQAWAANGTLVDLGKEGMGALLPLRVLAFFLGCAMFFGALRFWNLQMKGFAFDYRHRLGEQYGVALLPRLLLSILVLATGYAVLALAAAALIRMIVQPVYTFTEWVPSVLVEWKDIRTAFWGVWQGAASLRELRSPELCRLRYFATLTGWFSAGAAITLTLLWTRLKATRQAPAKKPHMRHFN
jgi:hypothetical protein